MNKATIAGLTIAAIVLAGGGYLIGHTLGYAEHQKLAEETLIPAAATEGFKRAACGGSHSCDFDVIVRADSSTISYRVVDGVVIFTNQSGSGHTGFLPKACTGTVAEAGDGSDSCDIVGYQPPTTGNTN